MRPFAGVLPPTIKSPPAPCSGKECYFNRYFPAYLAACKTYFGELADNPRGQNILYLGKGILPLHVPEEQEGY